MSNVELRAILTKWSACTISLEDAEVELRKCLSDGMPKEKRGISPMQGIRASTLQSILNSTNVPASILAGSAYVQIDPTLDQYLSSFDPSFSKAPFVSGVSPTNYKAVLKNLTAHPGRILPQVDIEFMPRY